MRKSSTVTLQAASAQRMHALGQALGRALPVGAAAALVIGIDGELGTGKTTFVQGVLGALGVTGVIRSPTYTLIETYQTAAHQLYHLDLYRLQDAGEVEALGLRDLLQHSAVLLIEWPARGAAALPPLDLHIMIEYEPGEADLAIGRGLQHRANFASKADQDGRRLTLRAGSSEGALLVERFLAVIPQ